MIRRHTLAALCLSSVFLVQSAGAQTPIGEGHFIVPPSDESQALDDVAMDGAGNLTFLYTHLVFSTSGIQEEAFIRRFSSTEAPLGPPVRLAAARFNSVGGSVAANQRGDTVLTWSQNLPPSGAPKYFVRWTSPLLSSSYTLPLKGLADVAIDNRGNFVAIWRTATPAGFRIFGQRYNADGSKRGPEFNAATSRVGAHVAPSVAMNPNTGEFVVVWEVRNGEGLPASVRGQRFGFFTGRQGSEFIVYAQPAGETPGPLAFYAPQVARAASGSFVVVWKTSRTDVLGQRYNATGVPLGDRIVIAEEAGIPDGRPHIAMAPNGRFVVSWDDQGTSPQWFRLFRFNGVPFGPVKQQSSLGDAPYLGSGRVAFGDNGSFVLGWTNYNDEGIFGNTISYQRYGVE